MRFSVVLTLAGIAAVSGFKLQPAVERKNGIISHTAKEGISKRIRTASIMQARKIDEENEALNKDMKSKVKKNKKGGDAGSTELGVGEGNNDFTADAGRSIFGNEPSTSGSPAIEMPEAESEVRIGDRTLSKVEIDKMDNVIAAATAKAEKEGVLRVPKSDPLGQTIVPPEIVFFGDPRKPPPVEAARDVKYHGSLLFWARHATVAPRTSEDRLLTVFPKGRLHPNAPKFRLNNEGLTYKKIFDSFVAVMDDLEDSKSFLNANIDLVPSKMFLRALTAQKLSAQSKNDLEQMDFLKEVRRRYILAGDQVFFPLNLEVQKAETRVMTFLARGELRTFAENWDEVEMSLHFSTLLSARLTWDSRVRELLDDIKEKIKSTVGYMAENMRDDLMNREFRKPGVTAELYTNASLSIQREMPELYAKIRPEIRFAHEAFFIQDESEIRRFAVKDFCLKNSISPDQLKERLKIFDASLAAVQGVDYIKLRLYMQKLFKIISDKDEYIQADKWYTDISEGGFGFETYEPDSVPTLVALEQRVRDTGSAFTNFNTQVLKMPTKFTEAFSGIRPKGSSVGNWLEYDSDYHTEAPSSYTERIEAFRQAYIVQTELRKKAESRLMTIVVNRMDSQDRALKGSSLSNIQEYEE